MNPASTVIGRLAPSPTGPQHLGNARTYLIAWLSARSQGGRVALRIEDIDGSRVRPGMAELVLDDLRWLGLLWDGEPMVQTQRLAFHRAALEKLKAQELVYPCTCTRGEIARAASAPHAEQEGTIYPGTCSHRRAADAAVLDRPFAWRFRVPKETIQFDDGFNGPVALNLHALGGDFVVWTTADAPAYQLAVVVDDAAQGVTEVIRGDDLIPSTPRQIALYRALGLTPPSFAHVPLVVNAEGRRLAKRHGDTHLCSLRRIGVSAEAVLGLLAWSCSWIDRVEPMTLPELTNCFDWRNVPREPFVLTDDCLRRCC
jgi:glutamyl-tRNA synthetase